MFKNFLTISFFILSSNYAMASSFETNRCSLFNRSGELVEDYKITTSRDSANNAINSMAVERKIYYTDKLIYKKGTDELIGDTLKISFPAFASFEEWKSSCQASIIKKCNEQEYNDDKSRYENDSRWTLNAYQINEANPEYYTLNTKFVVVQNSLSDLEFIENEGQYERYESKSDSKMSNLVFISNINQKNLLFKSSNLKSKLSFLENALSYSLTIQRGLSTQQAYSSELTTSLVCAKSIKK